MQKFLEFINSVNIPLPPTHSWCSHAYYGLLQDLEKPNLHPDHASIEAILVTLWSWNLSHYLVSNGAMGQSPGCEGVT